MNHYIIWKITPFDTNVGQLLHPTQPKKTQAKLLDFTKVMNMKNSKNQRDKDYYQYIQFKTSTHIFIYD